MPKGTAIKIYQRSRIRKLARLHGLLTLFVFSVYFSAGFFLHPSFLMSDIREKIRAVADTVVVMARVLSPPVKPIVTGSGVCAHGGPTIVLDWPDDENSTSYNIGRDGSPLTTGVTSSSYTDAAVMLGQTYAYVVTAIGPMGPGFSDADPVSVTTPDSCASETIPSIVVQTLAGNNIVGTTERHSTTDRNPRFTGVTNLSAARIDISAVSDHETISATVYANVNGYFEWSYVGKMDFDAYDVTFTVTDSTDASLTARQTVKIRVEEQSVDVKSAETSSGNGTAASSGQTLKAPSVIDFSAALSGTEFHAGDTLTVDLSIRSVSRGLVGDTASALFTIVDGDGREIDSVTEDVVLRDGLSSQHSFEIPYGMKSKDYRLIVEIRDKDFRSIREVSFRVLELPLFKLGGEVMTYEQAVSQIGWVSFILLFLFLWWLLLFLYEYYLYSKSERNIYGKDLHGAGYF